MLSVICLLILCWTGIAKSSTIHSSAQDISIDVPIPRGYTREQYVKSVIDYWTPERMASAKPLHPVIRDGQKMFSAQNNENNGIEQVLTRSFVLPGTRSTTPPACGRAFFVMGEFTYSCSGSVVNAENRDTIITAGHCVFNNTKKEWATNWVFVPNYENNNRPHGTFVARKLATKQQWKDRSDYNNDVAIVLSNTDENGAHVQDVTGAFGLSLNAPVAADTNAFGFPININNGETMSTCAGKSVKKAPLGTFNFKGLQITCNMAGGSSGGPWLQNYDAATKSGQQVSLTSFSNAFAPGKLHGPHFTQDNIGSLFQENQNA